ncbi:MAG TPA: YihY/virulence factor BrkB family protein [Baekduia sp.]|nr:YihY/virulence factor BrkB family protein [Baekduia sp.]
MGPKAFWRALKRFQTQQMTDAAAALTYYALMSMLPLLLVATSLFSLVGDKTAVTDFVEYIADRGADPTTQAAVSDLMTKIVESSGGAVSFALAISIVLAMNSASGAFGAAGRALNRVEELDEDRSFVRRRATDIAIAVAVALLLVVVIAAVFLGGGLAHDLFGYIGLGDAAADVWSIARWPVAILAAMIAYALIYSYAPDRDPMKLRLLTPGTVSGVLIWIIASAGFGVYLQNFSSYGAAYGTFGATIVLLLWLWLSACAFLLGAQIDYAIDHPDDPGNDPNNFRNGSPLKREKLP